ncbi:MAG: leucine--tRNA ligase [bacterium]|nr:leucine--tRNA ligase [bacterium]
MTSYNPQDFEKKWQDYWDKIGVYQAEDFSAKPKQYILVEFPYPSGERLHTGHGRSYTALDAVARKYRMLGYNVLFPMGWDAFGLPAENYALRTGTDPHITTQQNIARAKTQAKSWGLSIDWNREINTTDPKYYKWTQWIFLKLFEKGLAYQAEVPVNWCPACKTNLANEEVLADGTHERCGLMTERRLCKQWLLRITNYADRLLEDLKEVDYLPKIASQQVNWIGKTEGVTIDYPVVGNNLVVSCYSTRPDTNFGATFVVIAPEHSLVEKLTTAEQCLEVKEYLSKSQKKSELERTSLEKEKTGVFTGSYCLNRLTNKSMPIWVSDFVVASAGTGMVVGVPAHDERDFAFAKRYDLEITPVLRPRDGASWDFQKAPYTELDKAEIINSDFLDGLSARAAIEKISSYLVEKGWGKRSSNYHLRDWVFSRQHYWGEPIPIIHCEKCGIVAVPEKDLPVELPSLAKYQPTETGESPLATAKEWVETACPKCGGKGRRETDTMPNWAGSNWYYIRYLDPDNGTALVDKKKAEYWLPVDLYNGGMEHTTLHLLYSRFIYKFLYDIGVAPTKEPYARRRSHGVVLGPGGQKMSKSKGNVVNPDEVIAAFGADAYRLYEMFMGPFDQMISWDPRGVEGVFRFLKKVWRFFSEENFKQEKQSSPEVKKALHSLIKKVGDDIESLHFNTAVAALMEFTNTLSSDEVLGKEEISIFLRILAPLAPHLAEELYARVFPDLYSRDPKFTIHLQEWPKYDSQLLEQGQVTILVQVDGKLRGKLEVSREDSINKEVISKLALGVKKVAERVGARTFRQVVFVPGKIINFVV